MPKKINEEELVTEEGRSSSFGMETKTFLALKRLSALSSALAQGTNERVSPFSISASSLWSILKDIQINAYSETLWYRSE